MFDTMNTAGVGIETINVVSVAINETRPLKDNREKLLRFSAYDRFADHNVASTSANVRVRCDPPYTNIVVITPSL